MLRDQCARLRRYVHLAHKHERQQASLGKNGSSNNSGVCGEHKGSLTGSKVKVSEQVPALCYQRLNGGSW